MKRRTLRILILLWLGWYLSGPVAETLDFWDLPRSEIRDVVRNAGSLATLFAAVFCVAILLYRKLRSRSRHLPGLTRFLFLPSPGAVSVLSALVPAEAGHSPPLSLRI